MSFFAGWTLRNVDAQGYHLSDAEKRRLAVPLRFAPGLCALLGATFLGTQWAPGLFVLAGTALAGALLPRHPFDYAYGVLLARPLRTESPQPLVFPDGEAHRVASVFGREHLDVVLAAIEAIARLHLLDGDLERRPLDT